MSVLGIVKGCPLFHDLYDSEIMTICEKCSVKTLGPDDYIFRKGDSGNEIYLILSGSAMVCKGDIEIAKLRKGDLFGEMVLLKENVRHADVKSDNYTDILVMNYNDIFGLYQTNPKIFSLLILNLSRLLATRLKGAGAYIEELKIKEASWDKKVA
ncbi:cyclic nucleotide-binding domain-containing protein [Bacteriovorax sp. DB6_IX]|uniref:cyclic nucleotide-binding domain-containing protein n=1 Tax=Bacteriovorax sp. DB6_IX TaxID=1353530 RepID=UPI00038A2BB6|nr:cyclic nucleotide-binding domain-containing protein [Bacteriovorax sp. DB6_IX]EQC51968.1 cyclic nucleotide-binding domain protein [Bacteriovorax sp. DB6_IX]